MVLPSSAAGWVRFGFMLSNAGKKLALSYSSCQHWPRVVTANGTQVRHRASAMCLNSIHDRRGPQGSCKATDVQISCG